MRRLLILIASLAMIILAPATVSAADQHQEFTLDAHVEFVGVAEDGGDLYEGWHYLYDLDGNLVDDGPAHAVVYGNATGNFYTGTIAYEGAGGIVVAKMRASVIALEPTDDGAIVTFAHGEEIVEAPGFAGRGSGINIVEASATGVVANLHLQYNIRGTG